jgi:O-antigen/teichoic acid export membrane protein
MIIFPSALLYLGDAKFGFWMTILSLTSMSLFVDLGIGNGLMTKLSECHGKDDSKTAQTYISTAYVALSFVAGALLLIFGLSRELGLQPSRLLSVPIYDLDYDSHSFSDIGWVYYWYPNLNNPKDSIREPAGVD